MDSTISLTVVGFLGIFLLFFGRQLGEILAFGVKKFRLLLWKLGELALGKLCVEGVRVVLNYYAEQLFRRAEKLMSSLIGQKSARIVTNVLKGKGWPKNGKPTVIDRLRTMLHRGLISKTPWLAVALTVLPVPIVGEIILIIVRTFVWAGSMKFRTAIICLAITCPIRSYLWCVLVVYHRFG